MQLGISVSNWDTFMYRMKVLSERTVKHSEAKAFIRNLFTAPRQDVNTKPKEAAMAKVLDLYNGRGRGAELGSSSGTALGLLNAVTEFVDHERRARNSDYRLDSAWFGQGAALKQKALDRTLALLA